MSFKDFRIAETIGKGSFASVYKVIRKSDNKVYALKRVKISKMSKKEIADALNEIRFLASIRQKNIVGFLEAFLENNDTELCIVMEYCGCGDLAQKVERYKKKRAFMDERVIWRYLIQSLKALEHLHEKGICHRDLKVANTFLAEDGSIKIGDMNVSKKLHKGQLQTQIGTPYYMSPEIWHNRPYDAKSDIWSLGCMIYELCALKPPFLGDSFPTLKRAIIGGRYPAIPQVFSDSLKSTISQMLRLNPKDRPSAAALLKSPELISKLQFDQTSTSFGQDSAKGQGGGLMNTIKVPSRLNKLGTVLPKPCYPDVRPNSPSAWTVAAQKQMIQRAPPPLPSVASAETVDGAKENKSKPKDKTKEKAPPVPLNAVEDFNNRKPLAPVSLSQQNRVNARNLDGLPKAPSGTKASNLRFNHNKPSVHFQPSLDPISQAPTISENESQKAREPVQPRPSLRPAGRPSRVKYQHRIW